MPDTEDLLLTRPGPAPVLTEKPRPSENRPRLFVSWHPDFPKIPVYVYFKDLDYRPKASESGPRPQWAFHAVGPPQRGRVRRKPDTNLEDCSKATISTEAILQTVYQKKCFAADIAVHMNLPQMQKKDQGPYMADVLQFLYYAQDVIEESAPSQLRQKIQLDESKEERTGNDESSSLTIGGRAKRRQLSNQKNQGVEELQTSEPIDYIRPAVKSSTSVGGKSRAATTLASQQPNEAHRSSKRRRT